MSTRPFDLTPGTTIVRKELHDLWGGRRQGGISPSSESPNIFIFWSPAVGEQHVRAFHGHAVARPRPKRVSRAVLDA